MHSQYEEGFLPRAAQVPSEPAAQATVPTRRGNFFDYLQFNLPRLTKAALVALVALMGAVLVGNVAASAPPFTGGHAVLVCLAAGCVTVAGLALATRIRPWTPGFLLGVVIVAVYIAGALSDAPAISTGASTEQVALWNLNLILPICYFALYWALRRGILVAHPDQRNWHA